MDVISIWYALIYVEKAFQQKYGLLFIKKKYVSQNQMRKLGRWGQVQKIEWKKADVLP